MPPTAPRAATNQIRTSAIIPLPACRRDAEGDDEDAKAAADDQTC